jgi:hypothetical protein
MAVLADLGVPVSRSTALRVLMALPIRPAPTHRRWGAGLGGLGERDDVGGAWVEVLHELFDGAAIASGVAPSNRIRCLVAVSWAQYWNFSSSICSWYLSSS